MEIKKMNNPWRHKKVLITGHEGFLGSNLTKRLLERGADVTGVDLAGDRTGILSEDFRKRIVSLKGDIVNLKFVNGTIAKYRPHIIFHLAAEALVETGLNEPGKTFKTNIEGSFNVLEASRGRNFIECVIMASSDKAYGSHKALPYKEDFGLKGEHPYDASKASADLMSYAYFRTYALPVCVTRCGNIYGPGDFHFSRIVPDAMRSVLEGRTLAIRSDGRFIRDYIYVDDIVDGYIMLAEKAQRLKLFGESFNFSEEHPVSVLNLVKEIYRIAGKKTDYKILNSARYEIKRQALSSGKAHEVLGWKARHALEEGLRKTLAWYRKNLCKIY